MTSDERKMVLSVLHRAEWLEGFDPALADALMQYGRLSRIAPGGWAQGEGDEDRGLFVVIAGIFHTYCTAPGDRDVMIGQAGTGSVLGHATRFSGGPRLVTAICIEPALGRVRQCGVNSVVASGRHFQAALGVICSG